MQDADLLLEWVNMPDSLANKIDTTAPVLREDHLQWLEARLSRNDCRIYIAEFGGIPCGQVRFEQKGEGFEIDIFLLPECRGTGIAAQCFKRALDDLRSAFPHACLLARVKSSNAKSVGFFRKLNFMEIEGTPDCKVFVSPGVNKRGRHGK